MPLKNERKSKVLVIEDDAGIRESLFATLGALGFAVGEASNGEEGLTRLRMVDYDAVLLDINMPGMGGKETCRRIFQNYPQLPIIMLTVRNEEQDIVEALDAGACDYVTKPFQMGELTARLRAAMRRTQPSTPKPQTVLAIGEIVLDEDSRRVTRGAEEVHLTPKEYETLRFLMERAGRPVRHDTLLQSVWGPVYGNEREYLRVIVNQLRRKLEDDPTQPAYILTENHIGYRFRAE
ncbi:two-component system, OmpR family, KDP operon response regulator KdpE [Granulicella pectinivorans]|uniref:Two-component system, OmpR family, KDP operon response regulator KdpE n=1 Tax=Granulicella pectinivorans TaxID=474950 RepID=A0A1I6L1C2_9BACT|nr:response regulator transcription factor [Granulicella pectinivorans]SFR97020.1 two-component system, OmpR family, KDP operon response regulator KdpE [Granulicella pectinivorans]